MELWFINGAVRASGHNTRWFDSRHMLLDALILPGHDGYFLVRPSLLDTAISSQSGSAKDSAKPLRKMARNNGQWRGRCMSLFAFVAGDVGPDLNVLSLGHITIHLTLQVNKLSFNTRAMNVPKEQLISFSFGAYEIY